MQSRSSTPPLGNLSPALGVVRLSRMTDETSSPERQRADLARQPGVYYIHVAEDLDVSATKFSPFARPNLGPWLTEPEKLAMYDQVVVWKADRICRRAADMRALMTWADEHGKTIVFQQDNLTYDPSASGFGKALNDAMINLVAAFAEMEALNTQTRTKSLHAYLRENRSWKGGRLQLGYEVKKVVEGDKVFKRLVPSPKTLPIFTEIADRLIGGESHNSIASDFNQRGIPSPSDWSLTLQGSAPKGRKWSSPGVASAVTSDAPLGYLMRWDPDTKKRVPSRDAEGNIIQAWEPLITKEKLLQVRAALAARSLMKRPHITWKANPLANVAKCFDCGKNLSRLEKKGHVYLRCHQVFAAHDKCEARGMIPIETAWEYIEDGFLQHHGNEQVVEVRYVKSSQFEQQLDEVREEYAAVAAQMSKAKSQAARALLEPRLDELDTVMAALETQQATASGRLTRTELGETNAERWRRLDEAGRREMLIKAGVELRIKRTPRTQLYTAHVYYPQAALALHSVAALHDGPSTAASGLSDFELEVMGLARLDSLAPARDLVRVPHATRPGSDRGVVNQESPLRSARRGRRSDAEADSRVPDRVRAFPQLGVGRGRG